MTGSMKIGLVFDDSLDSVDGVAQYVLNLGRWLSEHGHEVHYLVGQTKRTDIPRLHSLSRNVRVRFNRNRLTIPLPGKLRAIRELLGREQFDVLHVQMPYSPALAGRIVKVADTSTTIVGTFHIAPYSKMVHAGNWLLGRALRHTLKRFDKVISVSTVARDFARATFGVESSVVPIGLSLEQLYNGKAFTQYADKRTIVFLGRLVARKGCQHLLAALARLKRDGSLADDVRVLICGRGELESKLKKYANEHGLGEHVSFEGFISEADKPRYLASADIAVYPSTGGESFGIVLLEALAAARGAVLAGDNPGYASVLGPDSKSLFDPTDHAGFAGRLRDLLDDAAARQQAHTEQQSFVRQFDIKTVGPQILDTYRQAR